MGTYAKVLTKRLKYYKYLNSFMYWDNFPNQTDFVLEQARRMDAKADVEGIDAIAPLFGLPLPVKGTMSTVDFPSSGGTGLLHNCYGQEDADMIKVIRKAHGIVMGKTNIPEFASQYVSGNYANGLALNPYNHYLITGGSSGGSAAAVATHLSPVSVSEDTIGSTREPAYQCHVFGYDPSRNHFPNSGNPGWTYTQDQVGLQARSLDDILLIDAALLGTS